MTKTEVAPSHTPAPWTQCTGYVVNGSLRVPIKVGSAPAITIAETIGPLKGQMCYADARLIAVAPDLLEAAKAQYENMRVVADLTKRKWTARDQACFEKLGAAIAKSEGR